MVSGGVEWLLTDSLVGDPLHPPNAGCHLYRPVPPPISAVALSYRGTGVAQERGGYDQMVVPYRGRVPLGYSVSFTQPGFSLLPMDAAAQA